MAVINTDTNQIIGSIIGGSPVYIAVSPDGLSAYATNFDDGTVSVIDTVNRTVDETISVGSGPVGVAVSRNGQFVYVANVFSDTVSVIDTDTKEVVATIDVDGAGPRDVTVSPDGEQIYVTNDRSDTVSVIDASNTVIETIFVGDAPFDVVFSPDGTYAYVTNSAASTISVVTVSPATPISVTPPEFSTGSAGTDGDAPQGVRAEPRRGPRLRHELRQRHGVGDQHRQQRDRGNDRR